MFLYPDNFVIMTLITIYYSNFIHTKLEPGQDPSLCRNLTEIW